MKGGSAAGGSLARENQPLALGVLCVALATVVGSMTSLTVALPDIGRATGASQSQLTWIIDAYTVAFAGLLLPCGALGDRHGRRRTLIGGLLLFAAACVLGTVGEDPLLLALTRGLAGLGAALVMPSTLSLITTTMRRETQARAVGVWVSTATLSGALGFVFAGLVLEYSSWRAILYISALVAALTALLGWTVRESADTDPPPFDLVGAALSALSIGLVVFGILEAPAHGWSSGIVVAAVLSGVLCALGFAAVEWRRAHPLLDLRIFRSRSVLVASVELVALFALIFGFFFLSVQLLQLLEGQSALRAGLMLMPMAIPMIPLSPAAPALVDRFGLRVVTAWGLIPMAGAFALLATMDKGETGRFVVAVVLFGVTLGLCITPATVAILGSVPAAKHGVASAVNDAAREVGAALGIAVVGSLLATGYSHHLGPAVGALPEAYRKAAERSYSGALHAHELMGPAANPALAEAEQAFQSGMHGAFLACAIFTAVTAVLVGIFAPGPRSRTSFRSAPAGEPTHAIDRGLASTGTRDHGAGDGSAQCAGPAIGCPRSGPACAECGSTR